MTNRLTVAIEKMAIRLDALDQDAIDRLTENCAVDFADHAAYQDRQALAHATGKITPAEALTIYNALGEIGCEDNGGWAAETPLATKIIVTQIIGELLGIG